MQVVRKLFAAGLVLLAAVSGAAAQRSVPRMPSVTAFRPVGEIRLWTFLQQDSVIGTLTSRVDRVDEVNGIEGVVIREELHLDFTKVGAEHGLRVEGEHYVGMSGEYLGSRLKLNAGGQEGEIEVERADGVLRGELSRTGAGQEVSQPLGEKIGAIDSHMADQLELFFALRGIKEGDRIDDSVFVPRDMLMAPIRGEVVGWTWQQLYKGVLDSVFIVRLQQPAPMELFINARLALRKINMPTQDMRVYLDAVRREPQAAPTQVTVEKAGSMIPHYAVFLVVGIVGMALYAAGWLKRGMVWIALVFGTGLFAVLAMALVPFQGYLFESVFRPRIEGGGALWLWALFAVIPAGLVQEGAVALSVLVVKRLRGLFSAGTALGAAVGAGMGMAEACYVQTVAGQADLMSWGVLQRVWLVLFHTAAGGLIGGAVGRGSRLAWGIVVVMALVNAALHWLPVALPGDRSGGGVADLIGGAVVVLVMLWGVVAQQSAKKNS